MAIFSPCETGLKPVSLKPRPNLFLQIFDPSGHAQERSDVQEHGRQEPRRRRQRGGQRGWWGRSRQVGHPSSPGRSGSGTRGPRWRRWWWTRQLGRSQWRWRSWRSSMKSPMTVLICTMSSNRFLLNRCRISFSYQKNVPILCSALSLD